MCRAEKKGDRQTCPTSLMNWIMRTGIVVMYMAVEETRTEYVI
jgi:hypothetical protein